MASGKVSLLNGDDMAKIANALETIAGATAGTNTGDATALPAHTDGSRVLAALQTLNSNKLATTERAGRVIPDGETITVDSDGKIHAVGGGGSSIAVGDVTGATASTSGTSISLTWTDPNDVELEGIVLAQWKGTKVVRKAGSAPTDVTDGTVVLDSKTRNAYSSTPYVDTGLSYDTTYYYRFFPYVSTTNITDGSSVSATPTRIEINVLPTQVTPIPTYTGSVITADFNNDAHLTVTGDTATNAGSHTAVFTPAEGYQWSAAIAGGGSVLGGQEVTWNIAKVGVTVPTVSGTLTYNTNSQNAPITNPDSALMTASGDQSGTDAGNYTATFTINDTTNYKWADDYANASRDVAWSIGKAAGAMTLSPNDSSITFDADSAQDPKQYSISGATGTVTITTSDSTVVKVGTSTGSMGSSCTITGGSGTFYVGSVNENSGNATVTIAVAASSNYNAMSPNKTISVACEFLVIPLFNTGTNAEIAAAVAAADAGSVDLTEYWDVGQSRNMSLAAMSATGVGESHVAQTVTLVIVAKDTGTKNNTNPCYNYPYVSSTSGRSYPSFILQLKNGLANGTTGEYGYMNSTNTNNGSWNSCARRTWCNGTFKNAVPSTLVSAFKQVKVTTAQTYNGTTNQQTNDYFFLPAAAEVFKGDSSYGQGGTAGQQTAYSNLTEFNALSRWQYYATTSNRIKYCGDSGSADSWWERSPRYNNSQNFCSVYNFGNANSANASSALLIAPAGCI